MEQKSKMQVEVILHKNADKCDLNIDTIEWRRFNDSVWYGNFTLNKEKYIHTILDVNHTTDPYVSVQCSPIIWMNDSLKGEHDIGPYDLKEVNWITYISHPKYWYAEIIFKLNSPEHTIQSYTITPLKFGYEIWVIATTDAALDEFHTRHLNEEELDLTIIEMK